MNHGTMFERLGRFALAAGLVVSAASAALAGSSPDQLTLVDPFVAYDLRSNQAESPQATVSPAAATIAAEIQQPGADAVALAACDECESTDDCTTGDCDSCGCDACDTCCCGPGWHWVAGAEATFLVPKFSNGGVATFELIDNNEPVRDEVRGGVLDMADMEFGPRVWVGVQQGCWGLAGRFWHLDGGDGESVPFIEVDDDDIGFSNSGYFAAYTVDLEATRAIHTCASDHVLSFGVRYANIDNSGRLTTVSDTVDGLFYTNAVYKQMAHGTGITAALSGAKPIGCTCLKAFYNLRGSLLWGPTDTCVETLAVTTGASSEHGAATRACDETMFIGEVQLGLQAEHALACIPANAFLRVAAEYQYWNADSGLSAAESFVGYGELLDPTSVAITDAVVGGVEANLIGFSIGAGITW
jgi:hypothetical protein